MKPTEEQQAILDSEARVIKINARAGAGKTTTLRMLADRHPQRRILYLVFNRRAKLAAEGLFPANVRVSTLHGLAYRGEGRKWTLSNGFGPMDLLPSFEYDTNGQMLAALSAEFLTYFLNSAHETVKGTIDPFAKLLAGERLGEFEAETGRIVRAAHKLASAWYRREKDCPHDFYLKMFHKSGDFARELNRFDQVLVDEGQDLSPIILDALEHCRSRIVVVGDTHQQIYGFRYAVDAMERMGSDEEFDLSLSFRFGKSVANLATALIRQAKGQRGFVVHGNPDQRSAVKVFSRIGRVRPDVAVLSRTNLNLFGNAMQLRSKGASFRFERDLQPTLFRVLDVFWLQSGKRESIRDRFIKTFESYADLKQYAGKMEDFTLTSVCQIVDKNKDEFPGAVFEMFDRCGEKAGAALGGVVLSTVHSAKGQQYREVYVHQDIAEGLMRGKSGENGSKTDCDPEDINAAYVAITRAIEKVHLSEEFSKVLTPTWKAIMERIGKPKSDGKLAESPLVGRSGSGAHLRPGTHAGREMRTKEPAVIRLEIGDEAKTPAGPGKVVEINGKECLVALDNGRAKVWQPIASLR